MVTITVPGAVYAGARYTRPAAADIDLMLYPGGVPSALSQNRVLGREDLIVHGQPKSEATHAVLSPANYLEAVGADTAAFTTLLVVRRISTTNVAANRSGFAGRLASTVVGSPGDTRNGPAVYTWDLTSIRASCCFAGVDDILSFAIDYSQWRVLAHRGGPGQHSLWDLVSGLRSDAAPVGTRTLVTAPLTFGRGFSTGTTIGPTMLAGAAKAPRYLTDDEVRAASAQMVARLARSGLSITLS